MNEKPKQPAIEPEPMPEGATETEVALFLMGHIDAPCEVEVAPGVRENIRGFYIREAKRFLLTMTNPHARDMLEAKIREYIKQ